MTGMQEKMEVLSEPDLPPGYRMTELGPLPEEWRVAKLGDLFYLVNKKERKINIFDDEIYTLLSASLYAKGIKEKEKKIGKNIKTKSWFSVEKGDFLLLKIWGRKGSYGFVNHEYYNPIVSGDYPILKYNEGKLFKEFIEFFLSLPANWRKLQAGAKGATNRQRVHERQFLELIEVPLPPLAEQRAIAHVLRTVQQAREATKRVIAAARELKKGLMRHLFTYGPVPVNAADTVPLQETDIGPLPAHWKVVKLGEVLMLRKGAIDPSRVPNSRYIGLEHISSGDIKLRNFGKAKDVKSAKNIFYKGDILYGKLRPYLDKAVLAECDGICSTDILVFHLKDNKNEGESLFFAYLMHSPFVLNYAVSTTTGVNHPRTSWKALSRTSIPLPPLEEQREIARILQAVDRKIAVEEERRDALEALFKALLHDLMSARRRLPPAFIAQFEEKAEKAS